MHATNVLRANAQEDDQDVKSDISAVGIDRHDNHHNTNTTQRKHTKKNMPISVTPYIPYQDALYYSGNVHSDPNLPARRSVDRRTHHHDRHRDVHPNERVTEERWRTRRRFADGRKGVQEGREDPWDPDSNQRLDSGGRLGEEEEINRRVEGWSEGVPESRDGGGGGRRRRRREEFLPIRDRREREWEEYDGHRAPRRSSRSHRHRRHPEDDEEEEEEEHGYETDHEHERSLKRRQSPSTHHHHRHQKSPSRSRHHNRRNPPTRSRDRDGDIPPHMDPEKPSEAYTLLKAAKCAAWVGAVEAWRCRKEPGPWTPTSHKARRVLIASSVGVAIGALRNGRLMSAGKAPYADAAMTGFYGVDFLKRVAAHTEHGKGALREQREWREERDGGGGVGDGMGMGGR